MPNEPNAPAARELLEQVNRLFNESNALYHMAAARSGLSDTVFWVLYALVGSAEPQTQNRLSDEWAVPRQTLNSAVATMVRRGLLVLEPAPGPRGGKYLRLTDAGRALAARTVEPVFAAEQAALLRLGAEQTQQFLRLEREHLQLLREEFAALPPIVPPEASASAGAPQVEPDTPELRDAAKKQEFV